MSQPRASIVILGGGPGGYEAALVAAQLGARVTVVDSDGLGGACVLTDCVPSKTLIASSSTMSVVQGAEDLGIRIGRPPGRAGALGGPGSLGSGIGLAGGRGSRALAAVDAPRLYSRIKALAKAQSADVALRLAAEGVEIIAGRAGSPGRAGSWPGTSRSRPARCSSPPARCPGCCPGPSRMVSAS